MTQQSQNGLVQGVPGKNVQVNGVLDLRGTAAERVAEMEFLGVNGVLLLDESNRDALAGVQTKINGTTMVADPSLRVLVQPNVTFTKDMVGAMPGGQRLLVVGIVFVDPEVPHAVLAEKFDELRIVGVVIATEAVLGALVGKMELMGITVALKGGAGSVVRAVGQTVLDEDYLNHLTDDVQFVNVGQTEIPAGVPEELIARKIKVYHNVGQTVAPRAIVALLKSRCETEAGQFEAMEEAIEEPA